VFGDVIVCLSLLGDINFVLQSIKSPNVELAFPVPKNSLIVMSKEARYEWKHGIPNEQLLSPIRISVTYRGVKPEAMPKV
jgi:alkylated DNA repair dioxygenase AlkB